METRRRSALVDISDTVSVSPARETMALVRALCSFTGSRILTWILFTFVDVKHAVCAVPPFIAYTGIIAWSILA
ncbi:hypothetical protein DPMN_098535 [Dreissena polymorpha]|uniref:Uncharacterized protein n=1 Tax=Dreissena polymorpha TaxID=45954 RepID=A0A9D4R6F0_DREPO|nr:hypothetical protein DPMN_098535 [Dreissena polymorpha]